MKNVVVRAASGAVYVALITGAILGGVMWFYLLTALLASMAVYELAGVVGAQRRGLVPAVAVALDATAAIIMAWLPIGGVFSAMSLLAPVLMAYLLLRGLVALYDKRAHPFRNCAWGVFAAMYTGLPMMALNLLYVDSYPASKWLVLIIFIMIWLNDTGAFCVGSTMGRHKMFPRLSPKKSWEGWAGGLIFCLVAGWVCGRWFNTMDMDMWQWIALGAVVCAFSTWGDLFESLLKRNSGVKDSGNIIPGHGGILDRIDSLLFVAPAVMLFMMLIG